MQLVSEAFAAHAKNRPQDPCWMSKSSDGTWQTFSFSQANEMVDRVASHLHRLGVQTGSRVVIWGNTSLHWVLVDLACWRLGAVSVPIYFNTIPEQAVGILQNAEPSVIVAEDMEKAAQSVQKWGQRISIHDLRTEVGAWMATPSGRTVTPVPLQADMLASIVYTSGTTGEAKGAELTHGNFASEVSLLTERFPIPTSYVTLGFLPLSHIVARAVQCLQLHRGFVMAFAESIEKVADNLKEVHPDFFVSVPRIFEKVYAQVHGEVAMQSRLVQLIFRLGLKLPIGKRLIFSKIFAGLGGKMQFAISGGAPLNRDIAAFFSAVGLPIYEGYGLTETTAAVCVNYPGHVQLGTVGPALSGISIRLDTDGEILIKGPLVFKGYFHNPSATQEAFTADGYFRSGDIGEITADGFLKITDRKKDLIVTAGGKKVAPQPIEQQLMQSPYVAQAFVYGDQRPYITALIVPNRVTLSAYAQKMGLPSSWEKLIASPEVIAIFQHLVDEINGHLARYESIKHFKLLATEFSVQQGELTPTLKLKRKVIQHNYLPEINLLYGP